MARPAAVREQELVMLDQDDAQKIAKKLGADVRQGRKHEIAIIKHQGKYVGQFGISRGSRSKGHMHIQRQLHVSAQQAKALADCPMSAQEYFDLLREKGLLAPI